jgi:PAS domain S-box-containing protein
MEHGNSDASCFFYVERAVAEGLMRFRKIAGPHFKNYKAGFEFGRLGYDLVEKRGLRRFKARTYLAFGNTVIPWISHIRNGRDLVRGAFDAANEIGDLTFAALSCNQLNANLLAVGDPLGEVQHEAEKGLAFARKARFGLVVDAIIPQLQLVRTLRGLTPKFGSFSDEDFDELEFEGHLERSPALGPSEFSYWVLKLQARFFAMDYASCIDAAMRAQRLLGIAMSYFDAAEYHFYSALSEAALWDSASPVEAQQHREELTNHHEQLELWRENCPENFENRAALLAAEIARIEGRDLDAMRLYEQAIHSAHANGFIHNEAIAYEVAARFYAARGFEKIADAYFLEARFAYLRWGADGKVRQLDQQHPQLRHEKPVASSRSMIAAPVEQLDLATVIKVSQAVSGEMVLEKLIDRLMRTAIEHAGAERGLLLVPRRDELQIEAAATTSGEDVTVYLLDGAHTADTLPESLVRYVMRTREVVILDDAASQNAFSADPYIVQRRPRSILSLPLVSQGKLSGILYLENNLTPHVFTSDRVTVLKVLASQAAISLENTRLYRDLEDREARIRRLVDANILGIFIWDFEGAIVEANEAFLHMLQYGHEDVASGRVRWTDLTPPEWREHDEGALAKLKATGMVPPYEKEYFRKDGRRVPVLVAAAVFEEGGGEGVAFALDLSEQKRAEEALRCSEGYLLEAQRLTHTGSWAWSPVTGDIRYWSEECYRVLGFDPAGSPPRFETFFQRLHPDDQPGFRELIQTAIREKAEWEADYRIVHPDGPVRDIHVVGHPVLSSSGHLVEFVGTVIDVTERRRAEQERARLRQMEADLAHINRVSTLGEMAASLAHEIKQPIAAAVTSANSCIEWLAHEPPNLDRARAAAARIDKYGNRAAEIIDRIRSLYKKSPPQRELVDVNGIIHEMLTLLKGEATRYPIAMRAELATDLPKIMADHVQLQQVFMNLMLNAIEAMKDAGGELTVKSELQDGQLQFSVSDTGVGLPMEKMDQIFSAFFTTKPQGSGMGLAISRSIVESHGGQLWASANSGGGATFHFTLPIQVAESSPLIASDTCSFCDIDGLVCL